MSDLHTIWCSGRTVALLDDISEICPDAPWLFKWKSCCWPGVQPHQQCSREALPERLVLEGFSPGPWSPEHVGRMLEELGRAPRSAFLAVREQHVPAVTKEITR